METQPKTTKDTALERIHVIYVLLEAMGSHEYSHPQKSGFAALAKVEINHIKHGITYDLFSDEINELSF